MAPGRRTPARDFARGRPAEIVGTVFLGAADKKQDQDKKTWEPKIVKAVRAEEAIAVDAVLNEKDWQSAPINGFTQNDPKDGEPCTEKTRVWVAYDDKAVYVAAFCYDSEPGKVMSRLGRRDADVDSDWFLFAVDPYFDKRTGYQFGVNPAGSITDQALSNDVREDDSWDGVWEGAQGQYGHVHQSPCHVSSMPAERAHCPPLGQIGAGSCNSLSTSGNGRSHGFAKEMDGC